MLRVHSTSSSILLLLIIIISNTEGNKEQPPEPGQFPWLVWIEIESSQKNEVTHGTGSLIRPDFVLSNAFTFMSRFNLVDKTTVNIVMGTLNPKATNDTKKVKKLYIHPCFKMDAIGSSFDVSLLELTTSYNLTNDVQTIALPRYQDKEDRYYNKNATVAGWGSKNGESKPVFAYAKIKIIPNIECMNVSNIFQDDSLICTQYNKKFAIDPKGAPLLYKDSVTTFVQIGVYVSNFSKDATKPQSFVRLGPHLEWIGKVLEWENTQPSCNQSFVAIPKSRVTRYVVKGLGRRKKKKKSDAVSSIRMFNTMMTAALLILFIMVQCMFDLF